MKKRSVIIISVIGAVCILLGIYNKMKNNTATSISIIGGADGPTSIFLAGKLSNTYSAGVIIIAAVIVILLVIAFFKRKK